jgi:hypothetical protein
MKKLDIEKIDEFHLQFLLDHVIHRNCDSKLTLYNDEIEGKAELKVYKFLSSLKKKLMDDIRQASDQGSLETEPQNYYLITTDELWVVANDLLDHLSPHPIT